MLGMFFFLTQFVQNVLGFSPLKAGLAFLPMTVAVFGSARAASRLLPRFGPKPLTVAGIAVTAVGMVWLAQVSATTSYAPGVLGPMLLFGIGIGFPFVALTLVALSGVEPRDTGAASSLVNVVQQVGGSLGLAILVTVFGSATRNAASHSLAGAAPPARGGRWQPEGRRREAKLWMTHWWVKVPHADETRRMAQGQVDRRAGRPRSRSCGRGVRPDHPVGALSPPWRRRLRPSPAMAAATATVGTDRLGAHRHRHGRRRARARRGSALPLRELAALVL